MKKLFVTLTAIVFVTCVFSQEQINNYDYHIQKSKRQKSGARVMLIAGPVALGLGLLIGNRENSSFGEAGTGFIIGSLGILSMAGSIPLFLASGKNKRKANLSLDKQKTGFDYRPVIHQNITSIKLSIPIKR
jgi:hypothetical protein